MGLVERYRKDLENVMKERDAVLEVSNRKIIEYSGFAEFSDKRIKEENAKKHPNEEYVNEYTKEKEENVEKARTNKIIFNTQKLTYDTICDRLLDKIKECEEIEPDKKGTVKRPKKTKSRK